MTDKVNSQQEMTATMQWNLEVVKLVIFEGARLIFLGELVWVLCFVFFSLYLVEIGRLQQGVVWIPRDSSLLKSLWAPFWICHRYSLWMWAHCSTSGLLPPGFRGSMESD